MTIEKYKELTLQKLGMANDCNESGQVIRDSIQLLKEKRLPGWADYVVQLKEWLQQLSPAGFGYTHWCNIQCAVLYLEKMTKK